MEFVRSARKGFDPLEKERVFCTPFLNRYVIAAHRYSDGGRTRV